MDSPLGIIGKLPTFGSATLEGFDMSTLAEGQPLRGARNRQAVRFFHHTEGRVCATKVKINEKTGDTKVLETGVKQVTQEFVEIVTPGDTNVVYQPASEFHKRNYMRHYTAFREGKAAPMGQSVDDCAFISPSIATELKILGCHTVEQLADSSDLLAGRIPSGFELREFARAFCKAQMANKSSAQVQLLQSELEKSNKALAEMQAQMASLQSKLLGADGEPIQTIKKSRKSADATVTE